MAKHGYDNIYKKVKESARESAINAVKDAISEAEQQAVEITPNIKIDKNKTRQNVAKQVNEALQGVEASGKIDLGNLLDFDSKKIRNEINNLRKELNDAVDSGNKKKISFNAVKLLTAAKVAEFSGIKEITRSTKGGKGKLDISDFISQIVDDYNISQQTLSDITSTINNALDGSIKETEEGLKQYQQIVKKAKTEIKGSKKEIDSVADSKTLPKKINEDPAKVNPPKTNTSQKTFDRQRKLYHGSPNDFGDYFDVSKSTSGQTYGSGGYLTTNRKLAASYGEDNISEWYANVTKVFQEESKLSEEEIKKVFENYYDGIQKTANNPKIKDFNGKDVSSLSGFSNAMSDAKYSAQFILNEIAKAQNGGTSTDILKQLGYQAFESKKKSIVNVFDSENIIRAKNADNTENVKAEAKAHNENEQAIKAETKAKSKSSKTADNSKIVEQTKSEVDAHKENEQAVKSETKAKKKKKTSKEDASNTENIKKETLAHKENEQAVKSEMKVKEAQKAAKEASSSTDTVKKESEAHKENEQAIKSEIKAKEKQREVNEAAKPSETVKQEAEAHKENVAAIEQENKAKSEIGINDQQQAQLDALEKVRNERKAAYDEEVAHIADLENRLSELKMAIDFEADLRPGYKASYANSKRSNFTDRFDSKTDALYHFANEKATNYIATGDTEQLGKAAGYYKQYVDALKDTGAEIQKITVDGNDMSKMLLDTAATLTTSDSNKKIISEMNAIGQELGEARNNVEALKNVYDEATDAAEHFAKSISKPIIEQDDIKIDLGDDFWDLPKASVEYEKKKNQKSRKKTTKKTAKDVKESSLSADTTIQAETKNLKEQADAANAATEAESKLADEEEKVAEKANKAAEAKKEEQAVVDNSEAVEEEKKEAAAIEEKVKKRKKATKAKKEEQAISDSGDAVNNEKKQTAATQERVATQEKLNETLREKNAIQSKPSEKSGISLPLEDLTPLKHQLEEIIDLITKKTAGFENEFKTVTPEASKEAEALSEVAIYLQEIVGALQTLSGKDLNINFKGLANLKKLTDLDVDKLDERLIKTIDDIKDFAIALSEIKIDDSSFMVTINNLMRDGEKLKNLATILKSSQKQIQTASQEINKKTNVSENLDIEYRNAISSSKRYYELRYKDRELTGEETKELEHLATNWDNLGRSLTENIQKLEKLGKSTSNAYKFMDMYNDDAGYKAYVEKQTPKPKDAPNDIPNINLKEWQDALNLKKQYFELQTTKNRTAYQEEQLQKIKAIWDDLRSKVDATTEALEKQGKSVKSIKDFTQAYDNGFAEYQARETDISQHSKIKDINDAFKGFDKKVFEHSGKYTEELVSKFNELKVITQRINANPVDAVNPADINEAEELIKNLGRMFNDAEFKEANKTKISNLQNEISTYLKTFTGLGSEAKAELKELQEGLDQIGSTDALAKVVQRFNEIRVSERDAGRETKSFFSRVGEQIDHANAQLIGMYFSWQDWIRYAREAAQTVIQLDSALTELRKVSDASTARLNVSFEESANTAKELGSTIDSVINQTADWSRLGYSIDAAEDLARVTTLFQTVGDNMTTDSASEALVSTLQGFQLAADESMSIVDKYNEVANHFAIDTAGIGEALKRSAASFYAANTDLSKSIALVTATNEVVQNPEAVGTLWKTMSARIRGAKTELEELGEEEDKFTSTTSNLRDLVQSLTGFDIMVDENTYKDIYEIILGIGNAWKDLSDIEQASLGEALAGKRNANAFYAVMGNIDTLQKAYQSAETSAGSAMREQENYAMSVQYSIDRLTAAWQEFVYHLVNSGALKVGVEFLVKIVEGIDAITEATHGAIPVLGGLLTTLYGIASVQGFTKTVTKVIETLHGATKAKTKSTLLDTIANKANAASEKLLAKAKENTAKASTKAAAAQTAETQAETLDNYNNIGGELTENIPELSNTGSEGSLLAGLGLSKGFAASLAGVAAALVAVGATIALVRQRNEELKKSASELGNTYSETSNDISSYKTKITELHAVINSSSSSYDEAKQAREQLLGIQDELITKYGDEAGNINLVTSAINGQINALDRLKEKQWEKTLNDFNATKGTGFIDSINYWRANLSHGYSSGDDNYIEDNIGLMKSALYDARTRISGSTLPEQELLKEISDLLGGKFSYDISGSTFDSSLELSGNLEDLRDHLVEIQELTKEADVSSYFKQQITDAIAQADSDLSNWQPMATQYTLNEEILPQYGAQLNEMASAYADYEKSTLEKDKQLSEKLANDSKDRMLSILKGLQESGANEQVVDYFHDLYPELQQQLNEWEFEADFKLTPVLDTTEISSSQHDLEEQLKQYSKGGNVDLTKRPMISSKLLKDVGWTNAGDGKATTFTSTYSNADETVAVNFTPIMTDENGNFIDVMEPDALQDYAESVIAGASEDTYHLQIGTEFTGEDAIQQAVIAAEKYHKLQEDYYLTPNINNASSPGTNQLSDEVQELIDAANSFQKEEDIFDLNINNLTDDQIAKYQKLRATADDYGLSLQTLIAKLRETNALTLGRESDKNIISGIGQFTQDRFIGRNRTQTTELQDYRHEEFQRLQQALQVLSTEDYDVAATMGESQWNTIAEKIEQTTNATGKTILTTEQYLDIIHQVIDGWIETQEEIEENNTILSSSDLADNLVNTYEKAFKAIGSAYQDIAENNFDLSNVDLSSITAIKDAVKDLKSDLSLDGIDFNTAAYENLLATVTNTKSSATEVQDAFENMAFSIVSSLGDVNAENYQVAESFLRSQGVVNAGLGAFMAYANNLNRVKLESMGLISTNGSFVYSEETVRQKLIEAGYTGEFAGNELKYLQLCMIAVSSQTIDVSQPIAAFQSLAATARAAGIEITSALDIENKKARYDEAVSSGASSTRINMLKQDVENSIKAVNNAAEKGKKDLAKTLDFDLSDLGGIGGGGGGAGGGGGGAADEIEETVDVLQELSSQLDEIQAAYSSLSEIVDEYNENGQLTVDQAQELINTDFRYLAMLSDENGQLQLNAEGFQLLAQAKLQEMQIQLAKNAIDTITGLQTEADAVAFLTYQYEGLKGAALGAMEAQLLQAQAAAHARGVEQGEAADKIVAGYMATKQAIGNVDMSKGSLKGKKDDKDKDKDNKDKDNKEEENPEEERKVRFNWLEKLVDRIQRELEKLSKRADKYFTYMEKNAFVDKQIAKNREMIDAQEVSATYYRKRASKSIRKIPKKMRGRVTGNYDPTSLKRLIQDIPESKAEKIQEYLDWQELLHKAEDAIADAYDNERSLIESKLTNILDYFDSLIDYQKSIVNNLEATKKLQQAQGVAIDLDNSFQTYDKLKDIVDTSGDREQKYKDEGSNTKEGVKNSYERQIQELENGYKSNAYYSKYSGKSGWKGAAASALGSQYHILDSDMDAYWTAYQQYYKNRNKTKGTGLNKKNAALQTLNQLNQNYQNAFNQLRTEMEESLKKIEQDVAKQLEDNETETKDAATNAWEAIKGIFDDMANVYQIQIDKLNTIIDKYKTIADLVKNIDIQKIRQYGVSDIFGLDETGDSLTNTLSTIIDKTKDAIPLYKEQYYLYADLIDALQSDPDSLQEKVSEILNRNDISSESRELISKISEQLASNEWTDLNTWITEWEAAQSNIISSIADAISNIEDYTDELTEAITESTQKIIDALALLQEAYAARASLIDDAWTHDVNGITEYGLAKIQALSDELNVARQRAAQYSKQLFDIQMNRSSYSTDDDYNEAYNTALKNYYESLEDAHSVQNEIYDLAKQTAQQEVDNISKLVENYKKALNAKKSYYDYDKTLKDKNKNIQSLQSQIAALENVSDSASKARLKALQAELEDAQQDLDDTVFDHQIAVETEALDQLVSDMTDALDESTKTIQETFEDFANSVNSAIESAKDIPSSIMSRIENFIFSGSMGQGNDEKANTYANALNEISSIQSNAEYQKLQNQLREVNSKISTAEAKLKQFDTSSKLKSYEKDLANAKSEYDKAISNRGKAYNGAIVSKDDVEKYNQMLNTYNYIHARAGRYGGAVKDAMPDDSTWEAAKRLGVLDNYDHDRNASQLHLAKAFEETMKKLEEKYSSSVTSAQANLNQKQSALNDYKKQFENQRKTILSEISTYQSTQNSLNSQLSKYTNRINELKATIESLNNSVVVVTDELKNPTATPSGFVGASTVSSDISSGILSPLDSSTPIANINANVLSILQNENKMLDLAKAINTRDNSYLPTISNNVGKLVTGVDNIVKNTTNINTKLDTINETIKQSNTINIAKMNDGQIEDLVRQLRKLGIYRWY